MGLLRDDIEPLAREIAHFLVLTKAAAGSRWYKGKYQPNYQRKEDLRPLKQKKNDRVEFVRAENSQARIILEDIREQGPGEGDVKIHPEIVLKSTPKAGATITIDNLDSPIPSEPQTLHQSFKDGSSEAESMSASIKNETWVVASASAEVNAGPASAEASVETGVRNTVEAAWEKQTGRSRESTIGGDFPVKAPPHTLIQARLEWAEQTKQRRIDCTARLDCKIVIGRKDKKGWNSGSPVVWESIDHLIAVVEKRGRVEHACFEHFAKMKLNKAQRDSLERIKKLRRRKVDRLSDPYKGNADIKVSIDILDQRDEEGDD